MKRGRKVLLVVAFLLAVMAAILLSGDQGILAFYRSHQRMRELQSELQRSGQLIDSLTLEIERLKNDTAFIERIAREKYGMVKRNEKLYKFIEEK